MKLLLLGASLLLMLPSLYASWPQNEIIHTRTFSTVAFKVHVKNVKQQPIEEATISLKGTQDTEWQTDSRGNVVLSLPLKKSSITIFATGYITQTFLLPHVQGKDEVSLSFQLKQNPMLQFHDS